MGVGGSEEEPGAGDSLGKVSRQSGINMPFHWSPLDNHIHTTQGSKPSLFHYSLLIRPDKGVQASWFYYVVIWNPH